MRWPKHARKKKSRKRDVKTEREEVRGRGLRENSAHHDVSKEGEVERKGQAKVHKWAMEGRKTKLEGS